MRLTRLRIIFVLGLLICQIGCTGRKEADPGEDGDRLEMPKQFDQELRPSSSGSVADRRSGQVVKGTPISKVLAIAGEPSGSLDALQGNVGGFAGFAATESPRVIIKTGDLGFEVDDYDVATSKIQTLAQQWGGFVSNSSTDVPYEKVRMGTWTIRLPGEKFDQAMNELKKLASKLESEAVTGQDVTEEYYDLEARLRNKLLEEKQVQEILRRSGTIGDILAVQRELARIREEAERLEGRKKYLRNQISMSTITVRLHEAYPIAMSASGGFWATIGQGFVEGIHAFARVLRDTITFLIAGLPVFALIGVVLWYGGKALRRLRRNKISSKSEGTK